MWRGGGERGGGREGEGRGREGEGGKGGGGGDLSSYVVSIEKVLPSLVPWFVSSSMYRRKKKYEKEPGYKAIVTPLVDGTQHDRVGMGCGGDSPITAFFLSVSASFSTTFCF